MLGAIIGDIAGSVYEYPEFLDMMNRTISIERRKSVLDKSIEELLNQRCFYSDDTVLTIAIADSIVNEVPYADKLREYGLKYINLNNGRKEYFESSFSPNFRNWLKLGGQASSDGNGAGMRVSPVGFLFDDLRQVEQEAMKSAIPSHNNVDAINGAKAIAQSVTLARNGVSKQMIKQYICDKYKYNLDIDLDKLREANIFYPTCKVTVPQAISAFLQSNGFEDAIKKAISIGGDTDTIACMTGAIAEAYYGIPQNIKNCIINYDMPDEFLDILKEAYRLVTPTSLIDSTY